MRLSSVMVPSVVVSAVVLTIGCGLIQITPTSDSSSSTTTTADAAVDAYVDSGIVGGGCGVESSAQQTLCIATSECPSVVVDTDVFPNCGFQVTGGAVQLICVCEGSMICSMGAFATCDQAAALLSSQTQAGVCTEVDEGRCYAITNTTSSSSSTSSTSSTSSSTSSSGGSSSGSSSCDKTCLQECGASAGCASICGC